MPPLELWGWWWSYGGTNMEKKQSGEKYFIHPNVSAIPGSGVSLEEIQPQG